MKLITYSKIGYNAPSQANWSYSIYKIDLINTNREHCNSYIAKIAFTGAAALVSACKAANVRIIETKGAYTSTGTPSITGVQKMPNIDSDDFIDMLLAEIKDESN